MSNQCLNIITDAHKLMGENCKLVQILTPLERSEVFLYLRDERIEIKKKRKNSFFHYFV